MRLRLRLVGFLIYSDYYYYNIAGLPFGPSVATEMQLAVFDPYPNLQFLVF